MSGEDMTISLGKVLEYCIFSGLPMHISLSADSGQKAVFQIEEANEERFLARCLRATGHKPFYSIFENQELVASLGYKRQALVFPCRLVPPELKRVSELIAGGTCWFSRPEKGKLINCRSDPRLSLAKYAPNIKAEITVAGHHGEVTFESRNPIDISQKALALFLDRGNGLVLPGDPVPQIRLYYNNEIAVETRGRILRVDRKRKCHFDGKSYFTVIGFATDNREIRLQDTTLHNIRGSERICLLGEPNAYVDAQHPLMRDQRIQGQIADVSTKGLSFFIDRTQVPIIEGTIFSSFYIQLPHEERLPASVRILYCKHVTEDGNYRYRIGAEFIGISPDLLKAIYRAKQQNVSIKIFDANNQDYDLIWEFFFESGFIYEEKRKNLQRFAGCMLETYSRLLASENLLIKKVLYKESEEIKGHISAVRFYDHAWIVQHLAGLNSLNASISKTMLLEMIEFFRSFGEDRKGQPAYITCFFRPGNQYPKLVFGETKNLIDNAEICGSTLLDYCVLKTGTPHLEALPGVVDQDIPVKPATEDDLEAFEGLLLEQGYHSLMRIENLCIEGIQNLSISEEYRKIGLYRDRKLFVAHGPNGEKAYAVCNYSSPGINLSELTNSFRMFFTAPGTEANAGMAGALSRAAIESYKETDMMNPVLILERNQPLPQQYKVVRSYEYWHFDLKYVHMLENSYKEIFGNIRALVKRIRSEDLKENAA